MPITPGSDGILQREEEAFEVARKLGYQLGEKIVLTHGSSGLEGAAHGDKPFFVVGILAPTGTPVDRTVHITLAGIEAIRADWSRHSRAAKAFAARYFDSDTVLAKLLQDALR